MFLAPFIASLTLNILFNPHHYFDSYLPKSIFKNLLSFLDNDIFLAGNPDVGLRLTGIIVNSFCYTFGLIISVRKLCLPSPLSSAFIASCVQSSLHPA